MNRLFTLQSALLTRLGSGEEAAWTALHMASAGTIAWNMAEELGDDPCLAACAASLKICAGVFSDGEDLRSFLHLLARFSDSECESLAAVVAGECVAPQDAALADTAQSAQVVAARQYGQPFADEEEQARYHRWTHRHALSF
ncbi:hypothetical protein [Clostridium sp. J1101437_171009_A5]|uniref:hypothetical protein n=1 Tax=Clostridium sp. J1101437_171009_A5 TaxID=2787098 RepID=UPI0018989AE6|nr:hypothetical protein [Clostridium sp. J1101437_171009_A5]